MGCFLACFGDGKRRRRKHKSLPREGSRRSYQSLQPDSPLKQTVAETEIIPLPELSSDKPEDRSFNSRKKVTFDLNVKTYEDVSVCELLNNSLEGEEGKEREEEETKEGKENQTPLTSSDNSTLSSPGSFPSNHRYKNFVCSDDEIDEEEEEDTEYEDSDFDDEDDDSHCGEEPEESFESCFSLPLEKERRSTVSPLAQKEEVCDSRPIAAASPDGKLTVLANGSARDRSQYVHSVLNPVENLSQWKAVKARTMPLKQQRKENVNLEDELEIQFSSEPTFKLRNQKKENIDLDQEIHIPFSSEPTFKLAKRQLPLDSNPRNSDLTFPSSKQEISVDTSLSNWLVSSEMTPSTKTSLAPTESSEHSQSLSSHSSRIYDDRPILGALTVEELKQHSVSSSPRRSPSRSPDEIPILGTVGSYWNSSSSPPSASNTKGIPNTTSKYREDKRVNWHNTPFEVRLERALIEGAAEAYSNAPPRVY